MATGPLSALTPTAQKASASTGPCGYTAAAIRKQDPLSASMKAADAPLSSPANGKDTSGGCMPQTIPAATPGQPGQGALSGCDRGPGFLTMMLATSPGSPCRLHAAWTTA